MSARIFRWLEPCSYQESPRVTGPVGSAPDMWMQGLQPSSRNSLPYFIGNLTFTFSPPPRSKEIRLLNFYQMRDFFLVTTEMRKFLEKCSGAEFETAKVKVARADGLPVPQDYWAVKVRSRYNCINASLSFAKKEWSDPPTSLAELVVEVLLEADVAPYYANEGSNVYRSYPKYGICNLSLNENAIPTNVLLFEPVFLPGALIIEAGFARSFESACKGGEPGYYFWTFDLDKDMTKQRAAISQALR